MSDYRIKVTVRNNRILRAIENAGFKSQAEFARYAEMSESALCALTSMRKAALNNDGTFCAAAQQLMEALGASPEELWTENQLYAEMERNTREFVTDEKEIGRFLSVEKEVPAIEDQSEIMAIGDKVNVKRCLDLLSDRYRQVLCMRYALGDEDEELTYAQCGERLGLSQERVRQMEKKAFRIIRNYFAPTQYGYEAIDELRGPKERARDGEWRAH